MLNTPGGTPSPQGGGPPKKSPTTVDKIVYILATVFFIAAILLGIFGSDFWVKAISVLFAGLGVALPLVTDGYRRFFGAVFRFLGRVFRHRLTYIVLIVLILLSTVLFFLHPLIALVRPWFNPTQTAVSTCEPGTTTIQEADGQCIGISRGDIAFDTSRQDGWDKTQAAQAVRSGDVPTAQQELNTAIDHNQDPSDAEAHIYLNDLACAKAPRHITIIVATMLTGDSQDVSTGRFDLQGAYTAQYEQNGDCTSSLSGMKVLLRVANIGGKTQYATDVAQQIIQEAQSDSTIVGVMGFPYSTKNDIDAIQMLSNAQIPMISPTASLDNLSNFPYFFRTAPTDEQQAKYGELFATRQLGAQTAAIIYTSDSLYSSDLATDFNKAFPGPAPEFDYYVLGLDGALSKALAQKPDLIYFAGYSSDFSTLNKALLAQKQNTDIHLLSGDGAYIVVNTYAPGTYEQFFFTSFAFPDVCNAACLTFSTDYRQNFDDGNHAMHPYGYTRADEDAILSYDATNALLNAATTLAGDALSITRGALQGQLIGTSFQGASGEITLGPDGNAQNKVVLMLCADKGAYTQYLGSSEDSAHTSAICP